ncbi:unnamed protein product [Peronospora belbahrii]|uniref:Uncharacterized protein n=1 Tax=Peronospora belbahrii TaxID=622444 RepID=A0ABN8CWL7_9STRA|nr:unnamed protein product [Peronospora belbahrii]
MALKTVVSTLVASSDADLETYFISNQISPLVHLINNYLSRGIALQTRVDCDNNNESHEAVARTLLVDSGAVFSLFLRLVDAQPQLLQRAMDCGLLHFYIQQLHDLYVKVVQAKRDQVVDLIRSMYEFSLSLGGMTTATIADLASACINFSRRDLSSGEKLLAGLHALSNGCLDDDAEHGSFLNLENFLYLDMLIEQLPRRRILPTMLMDDLAAKVRPKALLSTDSTEWKPPTTSDVAEDAMLASSQVNDTEAMLAPIVHQVQDFFPDLVDGCVELCLLCSDLQVEVMDNFYWKATHRPRYLTCLMT